MSHTQLSDVTRMNTCEWVMSRIWMSHVTRANESCHTYEWVMSHDSFICVTWLIHMCDMTHSCVWHDSSTRVAWLVCMCNMPHLFVWFDPPDCVMWLIHICDMTHSHTESGHAKAQYNLALKLQKEAFLLQEVTREDGGGYKLLERARKLLQLSAAGGHVKAAAVVDTLLSETVMAHTWVSHGTHVNESWLTRVRDMALVRKTAAPRSMVHCNTLQHTATSIWLSWVTGKTAAPHIVRWMYIYIYICIYISIYISMYIHKPIFKFGSEKVFSRYKECVPAPGWIGVPALWMSVVWEWWSKRAPRSVPVV